MPFGISYLVLGLVRGSYIHLVHSSQMLLSLMALCSFRSSIHLSFLTITFIRWIILWGEFFNGILLIACFVHSLSDALYLIVIPPFLLPYSYIFISLGFYHWITFPSFWWIICNVMNDEWNERETNVMKWSACSFPFIHHFIFRHIFTFIFYY